jgi:hypothetical protein
MRTYTACEKKVILLDADSCSSIALVLKFSLPYLRRWPQCLSWRWVSNKVTEWAQIQWLITCRKRRNLDPQRHMEGVSYEGSCGRPCASQGGLGGDPSSPPHMEWDPHLSGPHAVRLWDNTFLLSAFLLLFKICFSCTTGFIVMSPYMPQRSAVTFTSSDYLLFLLLRFFLLLFLQF